MNPSYEHARELHTHKQPCARCGFFSFSPEECLVILDMLDAHVAAEAEPVVKDLPVAEL